MPEFNTDRLTIRPPEFSDVPDIFQSYAQDQDVTRYLTWTPNKSEMDTQVYIELCLEKMEKGTYFPFVIELKSSGHVIGMLDFEIEDFKAVFGYALAKPYWNKGIMTEAMRPVLDWILAKPEIYRVWAYHDVDNMASGKVMEKLGLSYEGVFRKFIRHPNISNVPRDCKVYSIVKE